jgi:hypothetical protein
MIVQRQPSTNKKIRAAVLAVILVVLVGFCVTAYLRFHSARARYSFGSLPAATIAQISGFRAYYFRPGLSTDFAIQQNTIVYQSGVLVFSMKNPIGKTISVTEEATPTHYDPSTLQTTKQFNTEYGQAVITDGTDRTTGALFTSDNTWVLINAPSPIGSNLMQKFLEALSPTKL